MNPEQINRTIILEKLNLDIGVNLNTENTLNQLDSITLSKSTDTMDVNTNKHLLSLEKENLLLQELNLESLSRLPAINNDNKTYTELSGH